MTRVSNHRDEEAEFHALLGSLAYLFWRHGHFAQARTLADTLWLSGERSTRTTGLRAHVRLDMGDARGALDVLETCDTPDGDEPFLIMLRARVLCALGLAGAARDTMEQFLKLRAMTSTGTDNNRTPWKYS